MTVSVDSRSATLEWSESCNANDSLTSGTDSLMRVKSGPAGSHAISGSWVVARRLSLSSNALVITLKLTPGTFSFADPTGQSYVARLDGARTTIQGDLSRTAVSVRRLDARTLEEVDSHGGKIDEVVRYVLVNDSTMTISTENKEQGSLRRFPAHKQSRP